MVYVNFYWQLPCSSKLLLHKVCMNSSAVTLHKASFSHLNSHNFMSKYVKLHVHANTSTSIWIQSGSYINKTTLFTCEYINYTRDHIFIYRYTCDCTYSDANTITHKPQSIIAANENKKSYTLLHVKSQKLSHYSTCIVQLNHTFESFQFQLEPLSTVNNPFQACKT